MNGAVATFGMSLAAVSFFLVVASLVARWQRIRSWWIARMSRSAPYDLRRIFDDYLARINAIQDRRKLYPTILQVASELVASSTSSLLVRNGSARFVLKESLGSKPISFQVGDMMQFLDWLAKRGRPVTRRDLLECPDCADAKTCGLQYCVQFLAEACIPCFMGGELLAVINVGPTRRPQGFDPVLLDLLQFLSSQFALALHNASLYEDLTKQNLALEELARLKSHLLANISHEFRTPLSNVIGLSDVLLEGSDGPVSAEQAVHLQMIRSAGRRLLDTVSTLVDLSKLEANHLSLDVRRWNVQKLLQQAAETIPSHPKTVLRLELGDDATIYGDGAWLRRVFYHLLTNAVKYTPEGKVWVDVERAGEMLRVGIHDTGIGIEKGRQQAIFFPFVQANGGPDRPYEGNGLGLVVSRKVVELHGGRMWLTSQPGRGSHFYFTLPLKPTTIRSVEVTH